MTYVALFRGINVGGKNILPMKELITLLEGLGCREVKTYIQSGNVVFQCQQKEARRLSRQIGTAVNENHGFEPHVLLLIAQDLAKAAASNPFPEAEDEPKSLHLNFLDALPKEPDLPALERLKKENERFKLQDKIFYLHAPDGIGRSKLAANAERLLGVPMTGRNWRTVGKIMELAKYE